MYHPVITEILMSLPDLIQIASACHPRTDDSISNISTTFIVLIYIQSPPKVLEHQGQFLCFCENTEYIWGWDKKTDTRQEVRISAFISWYLHLDVLKYLELSTFGIKPPNSSGEQKY